MELKVKGIIQKILNEDVSRLDYKDIIPENLENWDSPNHLPLITALEE